MVHPDPPAPSVVPMRKHSVVVPVYFNQDSLLPLFDALCAVEAQLTARNVELELIFVDDGSRDASLERLLEIKRRRPGTRIIKLTRNFGTVHALRTGLRFVSGDSVAFLAADLQDPPELIVEMVDRWLAGSRYVICERMSRDDPLGSRLFSRLYYFVLRRFVLRDYPRGGYDLALMDKAMLPHLTTSAKHAFLPLLAFWLGYQPDVIHYHRRPRQYGKSRWTFGKRLKALVDVALGFSVTPIRLMSLIGAIVSLASFSYGAVVVVAAFWGNIPVPGYPTIVALITFLLGVIILMLGIIGEYLWRVFDETNGRPEAVIDTVY